MNSSLGYCELSTLNNGQPTINSNNKNGTEIDKKRNARKTIKHKPNTNTNVQKMLKTIYEPVNDADDDSNNNMSDFTPPPNAELTRVPQVDYNSELLNNQNGNQNETDNEPNNINSNLGNDNQFQNQNQNQNHNDSGINTSEGFNGLPSTYAKDYYKQYVPYYNQMSQNSGNKDQLLEKLNYMIHLLEEQQDVKTGHVMEEIILYSFLGIFMIFVVDSFARAAKYVR
jgi:hypothetical protein